MSDLLTPEQIHLYKEAFSMFDENGDQTISEKELRSIMKTLGQNPTEAEIKDLIEEVDEDGNHLIDFEEFLVLMAKAVKDQDMQEMCVEAFKMFDKTGKGLLNINDLKNVLQNFGDKTNEAEINEWLKDLELNQQNELDYEGFLADLFKHL